MVNNIDPSDEWKIKVDIGPISLTIMIDSRFFYCMYDQSYERHRHAAFEFHFIDDGKGIIVVDEHPYEISKGCYFIIKAGVYHQQKALPAESLSRYCFKFDFTINTHGAHSCSEDEIKYFIYALLNINFFFSQNLDTISHILAEIKHELIHEEIGYYTKVQNLFSNIFVCFIREIISESNHEFISPVEIHQKDRVNVIDKFFENNYYYKASAQELCDLVNISKSQLNRILKEKYNMTFKKKHTEAQIEHIKDLLSNTDLPLETIIGKTGYNSVSNFTGFFKKATGLNPKTYRDQCKANKE